MHGKCQKNPAKPEVLSRHEGLCGAFGTAPVDVLEQHGKLGGRQAGLAGVGMGPDEPSAIHLFRKQA